MKLFCIENMNGERTFVVAETMEHAVSIQSIGTPRRCEMIAGAERDNVNQDRLIVFSYPNGK